MSVEPNESLDTYIEKCGALHFKGYFGYYLNLPHSWLFCFASLGKRNTFILNIKSVTGIYIYSIYS